jgi:rare lipoprotein A (peptidoglycan hydrolase)
MNPKLKAVLKEIGLALAMAGVAVMIAVVVVLCLTLDLFAPPPDYRHPRHGVASWYTGSGMVAASRFYRPGTWVKVTYGRASIVVQITSAGPAWRFVRHLPPWRCRIIDLSRTAFGWLENPRFGLINVTVEACPPPISGG